MQSQGKNQLSKACWEKIGRKAEGGKYIMVEGQIGMANSRQM